MPVYTLLNIIIKGKGIILILQGINNITFITIITQYLNNVNNLALAILARLIAIKLS